MKKIFKWVTKKKTKKRSPVGSDSSWMRGQIARMSKMNQGIVSMALGKD